MTNDELDRTESRGGVTGEPSWQTSHGALH